MKVVMLFIPVVLSLVVLGAHFLRSANWIGIVAVLLLVALLLVRRPWVARLLQLALVLGAVEWVRTLYGLIMMRTAHDLPFLRMSVILGVVAVVTFCSALLFQLPTLRKLYRLERRS